MGIISKSFAVVLTLLSVGAVYCSLLNPSITWHPEASVNVPTTLFPGFATDNELVHYFARSEYSTPEDPSTSGRFNFTDQSWIPYPALPYPASISCVVPLPNGDIYIIGGAIDTELGWQTNTTVYKLSSESTSYTLMAPMHVGRFIHSCSYDAATNRIYAIGGRGSGYLLLLSGEYYSISENQWTMIANMTVINPGFSTINIGDGNIYTMGGAFSKDVQRYSIAEDTWTTIGSLNFQSDTKLLSYYEEEDVIFSLGGSLADPNQCEYFNVTSNTATTFPCLEATNSSIFTGVQVGTFVPERKMFYLLNLGKSWVGNFTVELPQQPTPDSAPPSTTDPSAPQVEPTAAVPVSVTPTSDEPSANGVPRPSRQPSSNLSSSAVQHTITALLVVATFVSIMH